MISSLYITKGAVLYLGTIADTEIHKHHSIQIVFSIKNSFSLQIDNKTYNSASFIINSNIDHKLTGYGGIQALLLIEPESTYGFLFKEYIGKNRFIKVELNKDIPDYLENLNDKDFRIIEIIRRIALILGISPDKAPGADLRINKVISFIETIDEKKVTIKKLASYIHLSESRMQHLFKEQVGISIKKYLQWKRMIDAINVVITGKDFTFSSYEAGFSDSAHMSRTFKEMFGMNLSDIFKNSRSIQVIACDR